MCVKPNRVSDIGHLLKLVLCCKSIAYCSGMDVAFRKCGYNVKYGSGNIKRSTNKGTQ